MTIASHRTIIYKYGLAVKDGVQDFEWPVNSEVIKVHEQNGRIQMWVEQRESNVDTEHRSFIVVGTGQAFPMEPHYRHLDTVFDARGLVWHVYEV
jgi:hypothetical protein